MPIKYRLGPDQTVRSDPIGSANCNSLFSVENKTIKSSESKIITVKSDPKLTDQIRISKDLTRTRFANKSNANKTNFDTSLK